jgi:hypothetical protein
MEDAPPKTTPDPFPAPERGQESFSGERLLYGGGMPENDSRPLHATPSRRLIL